MPGDTVPGDTVPDGPLIDPEDFGTERPTDPLAATLFDLLATQSVPANQTNCAIETLDDQFGLSNLDTAAVLGGDAAALEPVYKAAGDCGIDAAVVDAALATLTGG